MKKDRVYALLLQVSTLYIKKAEAKGRTKEDTIIFWLTGNVS